MCGTQGIRERSGVALALVVGTYLWLRRQLSSFYKYLQQMGSVTLLAEGCE